MAKSYERYSGEHFLLNQKNADIENLNDRQHIIRLREVKIKGDNDNRTYASNSTMGSNACGDYVCKYNILNCPNHRDDPDNRQPVKGELYTYQGTSFYTYLGCTIDSHDNQFTFDGIKYAMEFYPADYSTINPPEPEFLSTIYWKHQFKILPKGDNKISFYTGDITGAFKIIIQGVGENDVVYGEKMIMVTKP
jgi:hypothetical protein